jgi:hypothetical protein
MSTPPTLADLDHDGINLFAWCQRCHHNAVVPIARAVERFGGSTAVLDVRARCSACGSTQVDIRPHYSAAGPGVVTSHSGTQ